MFVVYIFIGLVCGDETRRGDKKDDVLDQTQLFGGVYEIQL